jgi:ABC-2 type transport system permease protein
MQMLEMIRFQLTLLFRNRMAVFAMLALPLILTGLFSAVAGGDEKTSLYVSDSDHSVYSGQLTQLIGNRDGIVIVNCSLSDLTRKINSQEISIGLVIEKNFGRDLISGNKPDLRILRNYDNAETVLLEQTIGGETATLSKIAADSAYVASGLAETGADTEEISRDILNSGVKKLSGDGPDISIKREPAGGTPQDAPLDGTSRNLIGFLVLFLWFVVVQGSRTLIDEKENMTFYRILGTPVKYCKFLACKCVSVYIYGMVNIIIVLLAGKFLLHSDWAGNAAFTGGILALYLFALTGITMLFVLFVKKQQQLTALASMIIMATGILGGTFFPIEIAPHFIQTLSKITPQNWAMSALTSGAGDAAISHGWLLSTVIFAGVGLIAMTAVFSLSKTKILLKRI